MASALRSYLVSIQQQLALALCIQTFPCQQIERHNKPEIEYQDSPELLLKPVLITRSDKEKCLIEGSINSVRISFKLHCADQLEEVLTRMYMRFIMQRAERIDILRRTPVADYDISFLITDSHLRRLNRQKLIDFVCTFLEEMDAEINQLKLQVNSRGRAIAAEYLKTLAF